MVVIKGFFLTILYIILLEIVGCWLIIPETLGITNYMFLFTFVSGVLNVIWVFLFLRIARSKESRINFTSHWKWCLLAVLSGAGFVFLQEPLSWIYNAVFDTQYGVLFDFDNIAQLNYLNTYGIILLFPICEELFFREYIQRMLQEKISPVISIVLSALFFSIIHMPYLAFVFDYWEVDFHLAFIAFFGGLISAILYYKSKSILPSILMHITWNLVATII